jgi:succinate dehydrogenase/fumarate reductase flavoprotein subunit
MQAFDLGDLPDEASDYLHRCEALQARPIDRLRHMNPLAIDVYAENGIDLRKEPLQIALCAQHNNGGLAVNTWWESGLRHTFVIGEMAGTHGVKRPGGAALNSGQVGGLRCATYIANVYLEDTMDFGRAQARTEGQLGRAMERLFGRSNPRARQSPREVLEEIRDRMTAAGGHLREIGAVTDALRDAIALAREVRKNGSARTGKEPEELAASLAARHVALTSAAYLKAIKELLLAGAGSRGSYLVVGREGAEVHPSVLDERTGAPLRIQPENESLRRSILRLQYDPKAAELFSVRAVAPRTAPADRKPFETAWAEYRAGEIYKHR